MGPRSLRISDNLSEIHTIGPNPGKNHEGKLLCHLMKGFVTVSTWIRKTVSVGVLVIGLIAASAGAANAADGMTSDGNSGLLSGNNISVPVNIGLNACGNGLGILGLGFGSSGTCTGTVGGS